MSNNNLVFLILTALIVIYCTKVVNGNVCEGVADGTFKCSDDCNHRYKCMNGLETAALLGEPDELCIDTDWVKATECLPPPEIEYDETFICSTDGIFPDTRNCYRFYECVDNVSPPKHLKCKDGNYFDSTILNCAPIDGENGECENTECPSNGNVVSIPYAMNPSFYTICTADGTVELKQCPDSVNQKFNGKECIFECVQRGIYEDKENCRQFYYCRFNTGLASIISCIPNYRFENNECVKLTDNNKC